MDIMFIEKFCKLFSCMSSFKGVTPTKVNEWHVQDFVGRIGPYILSVTLQVVLSQTNMFYASSVLVWQRYKPDFLCNKKISSFSWLFCKKQDKI